VRAVFIGIPVLMMSHAVIAAPLQYLSGAGGKAAPVVALTWGMLIISVAVIMIISALLVAALYRRRATESTALGKDEGGDNWLWIGVGLSGLVLLVTVIWTFKVLADIQAPGTKPAVTIEITGRQWWWQARYSADSRAGFLTANEIHIPTGQPVRLKLVGGDVIHSFWVPQLGGKMDAIPGQINETWIEASSPGIYMGQCTEYCGVQHSKMLVRVVAQPPMEFVAWWKHQLTGRSGTAGQGDFDAHCGGCHAVRGTAATGTFGPDLSHLMHRDTLASGVLPNNSQTLARWIADPQALKPGNLMPAVTLKDSERDRILTYLKALN
jgi:cytochrome c oxidase subunit 2